MWSSELLVFHSDQILVSLRSEFRQALSPALTPSSLWWGEIICRKFWTVGSPGRPAPCMVWWGQVSRLKKPEYRIIVRLLHVSPVE